MWFPCHGCLQRQTAAIAWLADAGGGTGGGGGEAVGFENDEDAAPSWTLTALDVGEAAAE